MLTTCLLVGCNLLASAPISCKSNIKVSSSTFQCIPRTYVHLCELLGLLRHLWKHKTWYISWSVEVILSSVSILLYIWRSLLWNFLRIKHLLSRFLQLWVQFESLLFINISDRWDHLHTYRKIRSISQPVQRVSLGVKELLQMMSDCWLQEKRTRPNSKHDACEV